MALLERVAFAAACRYLDPPVASDVPFTDEAQISADLAAAAGSVGGNMEASGPACPADVPLCPWSDLPLGYRTGREMNEEVGAWKSVPAQNNADTHLNTVQTYFTQKTVHQKSLLLLVVVNSDACSASAPELIDGTPHGACGAAYAYGMLLRPSFQPGGPNEPGH